MYYIRALETRDLSIVIPVCIHTHMNNRHDIPGMSISSITFLYFNITIIHTL